MNHNRIVNLSFLDELNHDSEIMSVYGRPNSRSVFTVYRAKRITQIFVFCFDYKSVLLFLFDLCGVICSKIYTIQHQQEHLDSTSLFHLAYLQLSGFTLTTNNFDSQKFGPLCKIHKNRLQRLANFVTPSYIPNKTHISTETLPYGKYLILMQTNLKKLEQCDVWHCVVSVLIATDANIWRPVAVRIFCFMLHRMFSIGERSGLWTSQFTSWTLILQSHAIVMEAACGKQCLAKICKVFPDESRCCRLANLSQPLQLHVYNNHLFIKTKHQTIQIIHQKYIDVQLLISIIKNSQLLSHLFYIGCHRWNLQSQSQSFSFLKNSPKDTISNIQKTMDNRGTVGKDKKLNKEMFSTFLCTMLFQMLFQNKAK